MPSIFAIGDIHGEIDKLEAILSKLPISFKDTVVFLGDYIDRGQDPSRVIERLIRFSKDHVRSVFLRGNHEQMMLDAAAGPLPVLNADATEATVSSKLLLWIKNGGDRTLGTYDVRTPGKLQVWKKMVPRQHWRFIERTQMEFEQDGVRFVHAGFEVPGLGWDDAQFGLDARLWIREPFLSSVHDFGGPVVFGHTVVGRTPLNRDDRIGLDTGACFGGPLTAVWLKPDGSRQFLQADE